MNDNISTIFPHHLQQRLRPWLWLLVTSIGVAGFFAFFLAAGRTPGVAEWIGVQNIFDVALVVHVDLSVLLWFLGMTMLLWQFCVVPENWFAKLTMRFAAGCFWLAMIAMALSPWNGGAVIKSNYVPMITNSVFYTGLALLLMGIVLATFCLVFMTNPRKGSSFGWLPLPEGTAFAAIAGSVVIFILALSELRSAAQKLDNVLGEDWFFERLYWAAGHLLQFSHTQIVLLILLVLASVGGLRDFAYKRQHAWILGLNAILATVPMLLLVAKNYVDSPEYIQFFTAQMRWAGGIAPILFLLMLLPSLKQLWASRQNLFTQALMLALLTFGLGGTIGLFIVGSDTVVPGHYHGAIGGITLAMMAFIYWLLPRLGYADVSRWKSARSQLWLYGFGQMLHAIALAWSGGYGALRKTVETGGMSAGKAGFAKGMIGLGGGFAILGGILFLVVCIRSFRARHKA